MELNIFEVGTLKVLLENQLTVTEGCEPCFVKGCKELYDKIVREERDSRRAILQ